MRCLRNNVAIRVERPAETKTATGIVLTHDDQKKPVEEGVIAAAGELCEVKAGDKVLFKRYAAEEVDIDGEKLLILSEDEIVGIVEP